MSEPNTEDVRMLLAEARDCLATGYDKEAARLLTHAAYRTHNSVIEQQVRELATQGLEQAGRFSRGRWKEIIRVADLRTEA
jgi:hypothetical protein